MSCCFLVQQVIGSCESLLHSFKVRKHTLRDITDIFCFIFQVTSFSGLRVLLICSCGLFGFFAFALMPVCLEVGVECTYPVAEATSAGLQWMAGYAVVFNSV